MNVRFNNAGFGLTLLLPAMLGSCGSTSDTNDYQSGTAGSGGTDINITFEAGTIEPTCEAGRYIYLTSVEHKLLRYGPKEGTLQVVGDLDCPAGQGDNPFALAIDENNTAWVHYTDGGLYKVNTSTMACDKTSFKASQNGWDLFDMAFLRDPIAGKETLYAIDLTGSSAGKKPYSRGLASISLDDLVLKPIGNFTGRLAEQPANPTGRYDGRLFGYFFPQGTQPAVAEIDPKTGAVLSDTPQPIPQYTPWVAFAHWGGSYYIFYNLVADQRSRIDRYTPDKGTQRVMDDAGFVLTGASVSTCAPTQVK